jgi:hypothetical protein
MTTQELHAAALAAIQQAQAAEQAATPGPWEPAEMGYEVGHHGDSSFTFCGSIWAKHEQVAVLDDVVSGSHEYISNPRSVEDAALIAAMRNGRVAMLDSYERQLRELYNDYVAHDRAAATLIVIDGSRQGTICRQYELASIFKAMLRALCADIARVLGVTLEADHAS